MAGHNAILVTFNKAFDDDDINKIMDVLSLFKGVIRVEPIAEDTITHCVAKTQAQHEILRQISQILGA